MKNPTPPYTQIPNAEFEMTETKAYDTELDMTDTEVTGHTMTVTRIPFVVMSATVLVAWAAFIIIRIRIAGNVDKLGLWLFTVRVNVFCAIGAVNTVKTGYPSVHEGFILPMVPLLYSAAAFGSKGCSSPMKLGMGIVGMILCHMYELSEKEYQRKVTEQTSVEGYDVSTMPVCSTLGLNLYFKTTNRLLLGLPLPIAYLAAGPVGQMGWWYGIWHAPRCSPLSSSNAPGLEVLHGPVI
ncbi:hypothetical protein BU25DRAFT_423730 [Macroventuria anomochaeta]|uniref:Uncharacterized protein n=1 Tax=Macroventuria anomochaeta TaxID=301207 RepID=A0ACB6RV11_9PLEO|nr:uncharacterized protein BU25DRAFT_423730 [Macroventuria anomochaeta]KAF2624974.1 hypothetical protein BU25DRAFT_423730 [Macroventuria anomochaeta]